MRRLPVPLIYVLILTGTIQFGSIFAVSGEIEERFDLSKLQVGGIVAATGIAQILLAVPIGLLADRTGARRVTLIGGVVVALGALGQGLAPGFETLVLSRAIFGAGFVALLTAGPTWLADSVGPARRTIAVGAVMPVAGAGGILGPPLVGVLSDAFGVRVPFIVLAILSAVAVAAVAAAPPGGRTKHGHQPLAETLGRVGRQPLVVSAVLLMLVGAITEAVTSVLGPLRLDENGLSSSAIGAALAGGAASFIVVSVLVARHSASLARPLMATLALLLLVGALVPFAASTATAAVVAGLVLRTTILATVYPNAMALGALGAERAGLGGGAVYGLMQLAAGAGNTVGPLTAGGLAEATSERTVYVGTMALCVAAAAFIALTALRRRQA